MAGAPIEPTANAMLSAAVDHVVHEPETPLRTICFLAYSERERRVFDRAVQDASLVPLLDTMAE
jgi:hypothetical protein